MTLAYIGLGSNLQKPEYQVCTAIEELGSIPGTSLLARSSLYRSKPVDGTSQPDYINAVVMVETGCSASQLLENMMRIESGHGRIRHSSRWQARTLDLDLLLYGREQINSAELAVPHPEIPKRNFVLLPLAEISPGLAIPGMGTVEKLLAITGTTDIQKLDV